MLVGLAVTSTVVQLGTTSAWGYAIQVVTAVGSLATGAGLLFAGAQLRSTKAANRDQILAHMLDRWEGLAEERRIIGKYPKPDLLHQRFLELLPERRTNSEFQQLLSVADFFETLGLYVRGGSIPAGTINDYMGNAVMKGWKEFEPTIKTLQETNPTAYELWSDLKEQVGAIRAKRHLPASSTSWSNLKSQVAKTLGLGKQKPP